METETKIRVMSPQKLEERKKDSPSEPLERVWPCPRLDLGLLDSRTVREYVSVVLSPKFVLICYGNSKNQVHHGLLRSNGRDQT